jgi:hypothetical protein
MPGCGSPHHAARAPWSSAALAVTPGAPSRVGPQDIVDSAWADPASAAAALQAPPPAEAAAGRLPDDHPERVGARAPPAPRRALRCACSTADTTWGGAQAARGSLPG